MFSRLVVDRDCPPDTFFCNSTRQQGHYPCIKQEYVCDGERDCWGAEDESQEAGCEPITCRDDQFRCATLNQCVHSTDRCDFYRDCIDGSDESDDCGEWVSAYVHVHVKVPYNTRKSLLRLPCVQR